MDGLLNQTDFADLVAAAPGYAAFTLFDVGCSSGIDRAWRAFGVRLAAFGFDPDLAECERLSNEEALPGVHYVPGFVAPGPGDEFLARRASPGVQSRSVWYRLSGPQSLAIRSRRNRAKTPAERRALNLWQEARLADRERPIALGDFARAQGIRDVDFVKIDVDGEDFAILNSIGAELRSWNVLGLGLEVSFDGSEGATEHSFHNTDRFMRAHGFDLFGLSIRRYSLAALPGIYAVHMPAETLTGRPQLGDAIYLRDLPAARHHDLARELPPGKLLKLAAIASLAGTPDFAAEILLSFRDRLQGLIRVPEALDLLAYQLQSDVAEKLSYRQWMAAFEADDPILYDHARPKAAAAVTVPAGATDPFTCGPSITLAAGRYAARFTITGATAEQESLGTAEVYDSASGTSLAQSGFRTGDREVVVPFTIPASDQGRVVTFRVAGFGKHGFCVRSLALDPDWGDAGLERERLKAEVAALKRSTSWRLTAPLRRLRSLIP